MARGSAFVERERTSGIDYVEDCAATVRACWRRACEADGIDPAATFVAFTPGNPVVRFYDRAWATYQEAITAYTAHGYVGLSTDSKELYRRPKKKRRGALET